MSPTGDAMGAKGRFDTYLFADYSGAADPGAQRRAIALWRLDQGGRARKVRGPFTRPELRRKLLEVLEAGTRRGRRVLFGIDHQFSWPRALWSAARLDGLPWREALGRLVAGEPPRPPLGPPTTFPAAFNAYAGEDIFHCRVRTLGLRLGLPEKMRWAEDSMRLTERAMRGTKPATRLGGTGAVAGQTLLGLIELHSLLTEARARGIPVMVWPLDALADDGESHVGVEVYPSFYRPREIPKTDDADARACCEWAARADLTRLLDLTGAPAAVQEAASVEGWILGAEPDALPEAW